VVRLFRVRVPLASGQRHGAEYLSGLRTGKRGKMKYTRQCESPAVAATFARRLRQFRFAAIATGNKVQIELNAGDLNPVMRGRLCLFGFEAVSK
jgi:hypothetical protein